MDQLKKGPVLLEEWIEEQRVERDQPIELSVVVPAYNERWRLPPTLIEIVDYLDSRTGSYELLVVDDGSHDDTSDLVKKIERIKKNVHLIRSPKNYGKGHAVKLGMLNAKGRRVLFVDADGSTPFEELERLWAALDSGADVAIGSRAKASEETKVKTRFYRKFLGRSFNLCVNLFLLPNVADTQCGFKLFSGQATRFLFERQQSNGFSFDLEVLYIARQAGLRIEEVPVNWHHSPGSKVNLLVDAMKMLADIWVFKIRHRNVTPQSFANFQEQINARAV